MSSNVVLDEVQALVATATQEARQIVIAGPGAGKSEVVGARCHELLAQDVYPEEILVISFSNAAVDVVRARTLDVVDEGRGVDCATIDSLAARVRIELENEEPRFRGFDEAVRRATRLMEEADQPVFPDVRHVIVDEVQDVVGVRSDFVLTLLAKGVYEGVGFTLLGDPLQSLFDFADDGAGSDALFLERVRERFGAKTVHLTGEFRARTAEARAVAAARPALEGLVDSDRLMRLRDLCAELPPLGDLDEDAVEDVAAWSGTTVLLCDTNARAGLVAARFARFGLPVELAAAATDPTVDPWVGDLLGRHASSSISFEEFESIAAAAGVENAHGIWRILMRAARSSRDLHVPSLATALGRRRIPPELQRAPASKVVASTVHRAKGREFDNVVLVDPDSWFAEEGGDGPAARRLFVAMSRARARIARGRGDSTKFWSKDAGRDVWRRRSFRGRGTLGVILEPRHARHLGPVEYDLEAVGRAAVEWSRTDDIITVDADVIPSWTASVDGVDVARTGEEFGRMVRSLSSGDRVPELAGGRLEGTETVVGAAREDGPGRHGLWLGARVSGPLDFEWK
ncbi:ATP-dependent helicase [Phycicoccus sp. DTK01]|uniref:ATP-dependent helicase n=1 Tax=Phycicoccus sp. DTK01 TaxID=2785745 RepID=UPI001A8D6E1A|nr:ATP-dependent helicase [Phycicoccus sp. DTK01]GIL33993.1 hypothetical protein PDTK01_00700 [Phycicoccus sp. DTK01]